jgi:hypothetical protein
MTTGVNNVFPQGEYRKCGNVHVFNVKAELRLSQTSYHVLPNGGHIPGDTWYNIEIHTNKKVNATDTLIFMYKDRLVAVTSIKEAIYASDRVSSS